MKPLTHKLILALSAALFIVFAALYVISLSAGRQGLLRVASVGGAAICVFLGGRAASRLWPEHEKAILRGAVIGCFCLYLFLLLSLLFFDRGYGRAGMSRLHLLSAEALRARADKINLRPGKTIIPMFKRIHVPLYRENLIGNTVAFMPFGLFLPLLFKRMRRFWPFLSAVTAVSVGVEALQLLLMTGSCDVDDVILNVAGALIAFGFFSIPKIKKLLLRTVAE